MARRLGAATLIGALFVVAGAIGLVGAWGAYLTDTAIVARGDRAVGQVEHKDIAFAADGDSDYVIRYRFVTDGGDTVRAQRGVSERLWHALAVGDTLRILYASERPSRNFPAGEGVTSWFITFFVSLAGGLFLLVGAALILGAGRAKGSQVTAE